MASLNKVMVIGHLGRDPETRYLTDGAAVTNVSIATTDTWKDKNSGEKQQRTEWHRIVFFGKVAEIAGEYLKKGSQVYIEGALRTRKWTDKDGNDKYTTEINADKLVMLGAKPNGESTAQRPSTRPIGPAAAPAAGKKSGGHFDDMDDDIPF